MPRTGPRLEPGHLRFRIPSPVRTAWPQNDVVPFLYFGPDDRAAPIARTAPRRPASPVPAVVVLHGLGLSKETFVPAAPHLRKLGYATLLLDLPFHGERAVADTDHLFPFRGNLTNYVIGIRQMVGDVAACVAWLRRRREVDQDRLAVVGFSLGGVLASLLMGLGMGFAAGVSLMAAGDWADLIYETALGADVRTDLERAGVTPGETRAALRELSASTYSLAVRSLLIVAGRRDLTVPPRITERFWKTIATDGNRIVWKRSGHVPPVRATAREVLSFLGEKLRPTDTRRGHLSRDAGHRYTHGQRLGPTLPTLGELPRPV